MWLLLTQKHLCWSLFSILSIVKFFRALTLKNICKWLFLKMCLQKSFIKRINFTLKKTIFSTSISNFISWLVSQEVFIHSHTIFLWHGEKQKQPPEVLCKRRCSYKFRKIPRKTPVPESLFKKVAGLRKKRLWQGNFPVNFAKLSRKPFLQNTSGWLPLEK